MPSRSASARAASSAAGLLPSIAQYAPSNCAPAPTTLSSGCIENRSCGASRSSGADALTWPTSAPGGTAAAERTSDLGVGPTKRGRECVAHASGADDDDGWHDINLTGAA